MPHEASYHLLDSTFTDANEGLETPDRHASGKPREPAPVSRVASGDQDHFNTLDAAPFTLLISNLDHDDPDGYQPDSYPRGRPFNDNTFSLAAAPRMPEIRVTCEVAGFAPSQFPIHWRLQLRHVLCRHQNQGHYQYRGTCEVLTDTWQGHSTESDFTLFQENPPSTLAYDFNAGPPDGPVMGGHGILTVCAWPDGCEALLQDYVHLRITGTNPTRDDVLAWIDQGMSGHDANIVHMVRAIFAHESGFNQFTRNAQSSRRFVFTQRHHQNDASQPDCRVSFDYPNDPPDFPLVSYDYGVGISQYTKTRGRTLGERVIWDWRENIKTGINLFLDCLSSTQHPGGTWRQWAVRAWEPYAGSGTQAEQYARDLSGSPEGQQVENVAVPEGVVLSHLDMAPLPESPPPWPPENLQQADAQPAAAATEGGTDADEP